MISLCKFKFCTSRITHLKNLSLRSLLNEYISYSGGSTCSKYIRRKTLPLLRSGPWKGVASLVISLDIFLCQSVGSRLYYVVLHLYFLLWCAPFFMRWWLRILTCLVLLLCRLCSSWKHLGAASILQNHI